MREKKFTPNDNGSVIRMLSAKYARCKRGGIGSFWERWL